ncbi:1-deoxy-D-xylulose-5-phosphate synthase N-terminal domain-containing protein [Staphylococcus epidermidis]|uniref:1-deoxy-D-xylulose-5-phosphate synthase N-terminal domain-containing protein n=1 Tax=Staphylococcus epidermidis TaxID=1282 RepID=UPI0002E4B9E0|nr:1-deoxy-D-xylulose-5-phosphate synthase N-terminal domain-containing protein [Staphylococcus epidermidis]
MINPVKKYETDAKELRKELVDIAASEYGCHLGGSLSVLDLLYSSYIFFKNNEIILSKGHTSAALYSVLYKVGKLKEKPSLTYGKKDSLLTGHPNHLIPSISFSTGSLGHGLPYGIGLSLSNKINNKSENKDVIILGGDGELQEGLIWETLQVASGHNISNFIYIIDRNNGQNDGETNKISPFYDLKKRFLSFGFDVIEINGHDYNEIFEAFSKKRADTALIILANTVKGKGIPQLEGNFSSHYVKINNDVAQNWKEELV